VRHVASGEHQLDQPVGRTDSRQSASLSASPTFQADHVATAALLPGVGDHQAPADPDQMGVSSPPL
jgi:hypothetical protein